MEEIQEQQQLQQEQQKQQQEQQQLIKEQQLATDHEEFLELPVLASGSLDGLLGKGGHKSTLQKRRAMIESHIGIERGVHWLARQSMGPGRVFALTQSLVLVVLHAAMRNANKGYLTELEQRAAKIVSPMFKTHVTQDLLNSIADETKIRITKHWRSGTGQRASGKSKAITNVVNGALLEIFSEPGSYRSLAQDYSEQVATLVRSVDGLDRLTGHIVKTDKEKTLVAIGSGDEGEYRWVSNDLLSPLGFSEEGQAFVLLEQTSDADNRLSLFIPAVEPKLMADSELAEEVRLLREAEIPLSKYKAPSY